MEDITSYNSSSVSIIGNNKKNWTGTQTLELDPKKTKKKQVLISLPRSFPGHNIHIDLSLTKLFLECSQLPKFYFVFLN